MQNSEDEQVVTVLPEDELTVITDQSSKGEAACNTLSLNLRTAALSVQLQTKTAHAPVINELTIRLECAQTQAREAEERLANAFCRIGYLESQLNEKDKLIAALRSKT